MSSGLHREADTSLSDVTWKKRRWKGLPAYCESKFHDILLAFAVARRWPDVFSNALEPGWVPTKMGGQEAPEDLRDGTDTCTRSSALSTKHSSGLCLTGSRCRAGRRGE